MCPETCMHIHCINNHEVVSVKGVLLLTAKDIVPLQKTHCRRSALPDPENKIYSVIYVP